MRMATMKPMTNADNSSGSSKVVIVIVMMKMMTMPLGLGRARQQKGATVAARPCHHNTRAVAVAPGAPIATIEHAGGIVHVVETALALG